MAVTVEHMVAIRVVPTISDGLEEPALLRIAIIVAGINCTEEPFITKNIHMASVARSFFYLTLEDVPLPLHQMEWLHSQDRTY